MKSNRLLPSVLFVLLACSPGLAFAELTAWLAPSTSKLLRDAKPTSSAQQWQLAAARNETEACQLVLLSDRPVSGVAVSVSDFRAAAGSALLPVKLFKVEYVPNIVGDVAYPDPLPPLKPLELQPHQAQPVWISVKVPRDAQAGDYSATVRVKAEGFDAAYPLRLHVWGFTLPETPSGTTAFGLSKGDIARQHGVPANSTEAARLYAAYYEMLLDHKVSAYEIPADLMSDDAAKYLNDPRMTSYQIPFPGDDSALKALAARLVQRGWYAKGFFYPIDEPANKQSYDTLLTINHRLQQLTAGYHWVVPFYCKPDWGGQATAFDLMANRVNIWCPNTNYFDSEPKTRPALAIRHALGDRIWWYVCCGPGAPYNNFFVDMSAISHRLLFWQQKRENVEGLLYWNATYWNPASTKDPWTDMGTVKDINKDLRGDGSLFYPGKHVGVDGPVNSIRLEMIRDGLEDFDYLTLADAWLGKETAQGFVAKMVRGLKDYEQDPLALEKTRCELGDLLEKKRPAKAKTP